MTGRFHLRPSGPGGLGGGRQGSQTGRRVSESHRAKAGDLCQHEIKFRGQAMGHWGSLRTTWVRPSWQGWQGPGASMVRELRPSRGCGPARRKRPRCSVQPSSVTWQHGLPLAGSAWKLLPRWWGDHLVYLAWICSARSPSSSQTSWFLVVRVLLRSRRNC